MVPDTVLILTVHSYHDTYGQIHYKRKPEVFPFSVIPGLKYAPVRFCDQYNALGAFCFARGNDIIPMHNRACTRNLERSRAFVVIRVYVDAEDFTAPESITERHNKRRMHACPARNGKQTCDLILCQRYIIVSLHLWHVIAPEHIVFRPSALDAPIHEFPERGKSVNDSARFIAVFPHALRDYIKITYCDLIKFTAAEGGKHMQLHVCYVSFCRCRS